MIGNNTLELCIGEMNRAVEYYLNQVQFKEPVKVTKVSEKRNSPAGGFAVEIAPAEPDPGPQP